MADSKRETLVQAIKTLAATITVENGYETDIGLHTFNWKSGPFEDSELPGQNICDTKEETEASSVGTTQEDSTLHIEWIVMAQDGTDTAKTVRKMIADVTKAVKSSSRFGLGFVLRMKVERDNEMIVQQNKKTVGGAVLRFDVIYRAGLFDPYN